MLMASCHCGDIKLEVARKPRSLTECNCSICRRYGALWAYYSRRSVRMAPQSKTPAIYQRRENGLEFNVCPKCGCVMFHEQSRKRGADTRIGLNTRMLDPEAIAGLSARLLDGAKTWKVLGTRRLPR